GEATLNDDLRNFITPNPHGKSHHVAGYIITDENGNRHVYGESVYNLIKEEVAFAVGGEPTSEADENSELIQYAPVIDNTTGNTKGKDHFFNKEITPAYAHTYLISSVLSSDYQDLTGNGPSDDDLGNYTHFFYEVKADDYKWRVPYQENRASYSNGLNTN